MNTEWLKKEITSLTESYNHLVIENEKKSYSESLPYHQYSIKLNKTFKDDSTIPILS